MSRISNLLDVLKVEVEQPTGLLKNLLANPSGELGAWAWATASGVLTTGSDVNGKYLEWQTSALPGGPTAQQLLSEAVPVTPGQYVGAAWDAISFDASMAVAPAFVYYNSSGVNLGQVPVGPAYSSATGRLTVAAQAVPATAVTARLSFGVSNGVGGGVLAGKRFRFRNAVVATAATAAPLGPVYTNSVVNPSFETSVVNWTSPSDSTVRTNVGGVWKGRLTPGFGRTHALVGTNAGVTPGKTYRVGFKWTPVGTGTLYRYLVEWYAHLGDPMTKAGLLSTVGGPAWATDPSGSYMRNLVAPAGAEFARLWIESVGQIDVDDVMVTDDDTLPVAYWDGNTPDVAGSLDYGWTGTANLSASTKSASKLPYIPPITYQEIQGSAVSIGLQQRTFDCTLSVVIRDAALDPATANLIRPGRAVRVSVKDSTGVWKTFFQGKAARPAVDYGDLKRYRRPTITLTAYGPGADLAGSPVAGGVATIPQLAQVLEGIRIPYLLDGSTNQVPTAAVVSSNDAATALDQVVLTRDSNRGYAWIDRQGLLRAYTSRNVDYYGTGYANFVEGDYTALGLSWDAEAIINAVSVILLRLNPTTGETEEVPYGPYIDYTSFREWGPSPAEYRVQGTVDPATWAAAILASNSTGTQRVENLRVPITDTDDLTPLKALIDLYALSTVRNVDRGILIEQRVQGIDHTITWSGQKGIRWYMDLTFQGVDDAAAPMAVTPVPTGPDLLDGVWYEVGAAGQPAFQNSWANFGGALATVAFMRKDGVVRLKGLGKNGTAPLMFTLPPGFRPEATRIFPAVVTALNTGAATAGTAHTHPLTSVAGRVSVTTGGAVSQDSGTNASVSLDGITFVAGA